MLLLNKSTFEGEIKGIRIDSRRQLLHQIFVDNMGIFMESLEENYPKIASLVSMYERILGALLNLNKFVLIQLNNGPSSLWFTQVECKVTLKGELVKYLGCPIGFNVPPNKILRFLLDNIHKKFMHWSNRLLMMVGRLILMRHIIRSIPVYHLMLLELT